MSCGKGFNTGSCVCDVLAEIAAAQKDDTPTDCLGSCDQSIRELMGGIAPSHFNTIPVQLICTTANQSPGASMVDVCGTVFQGVGYRRSPQDPNVIERNFSTFFRVDSVDEKRGCAVLELLCNDDTGKGKGKCPPDEFDVELERTGICMTIDCTCFCGVVCLPAMSLPKA